MGAGRCKLHGGSTPTHETAGRRVLARRQVEREFGQLEALLGETSAENADPLLTLLEAVARARGMAWAYEVLAAGLPLTIGPNHLGDLVPHPYVELARVWTVEAARISKLALDAGVEERKVRLAEAEGNLLGQALRRFVEQLVEELVAAGLDGGVVRRVVMERAPVLMRRAVALVRAEDVPVVEVSSEEGHDND